MHSVRARPNQDFEFRQVNREASGVPSRSTSEDGLYTFETMRLKIGDRLQIQLPARFLSERVIVRLIGYVNQLSLLVTSPRESNGLRLPLEEGEEVVVRAFASQSAFAFSSMVEKLVRLPFEYLHLSFPLQVKGTVVRKAPRVSTSIICTVNAEQSGEEALTGILVNLSASGALLASRHAVAKRDEMVKLGFRLNLHGTEVFLNLNAVVRARCSDGSPANPTPVHHGLEFFDLTPNDRMVLQSLVYQQIIEQPNTVL